MDSKYMIINLDYLRDVADGDVSFIKQMVIAYLSLGRVDMDCLLTEYKKNNWELVGRAAHKMKSASQSMGVLKIGTLAGEIECTIRNAQNDAEVLNGNLELHTKIDEMERAFSEALIEFELELDRLNTL